jgi:Spy/CpxP family protein refolding chaperone
MKKIMTAMGLVMILILGVTYAYAHDAGVDPGHKGMGHSHEGWGHGKGLSLTPEQKAKFQEMRRNFRRDNAQLIGSLVAKKIELHALWTDPKADSKTILDKATELRDVQNQLRDKFVGAMLEARKSLTPEQIAHWKPDWMWGHGRRHGHGMMGHGRMMGHEGMTEHGGMKGHGGMMGHDHGKCS